MPRKVAKRSYKKRPYKSRRYKRRYRRRFYKRNVIKKPEIHIVEYDDSGTPFNNTSLGMGIFQNITSIGSTNNPTDMDDLKFTLNGKSIEGKKIRLKYLYIKGYVKVSSTADTDDFNCKLMVFRWKRNTTNQSLNWGELVNSTDQTNFNVNSPSTWTEDNRLSMMYKQDWKNDIKINFYRRVKNLYRKYDDGNNIIPFKIRIPLYDCVLSCDCNKSANVWNALAEPSTNGLYFTYLSNKYDANTTLALKWKLYYTDY